MRLMSSLCSQLAVALDARWGSDYEHGTGPDSQTLATSQAAKIDVFDRRQVTEFEAYQLVATAKRVTFVHNTPPEKLALTGFPSFTLSVLRGKCSPLW